MNLSILMDPLSTINPVKDSTVAMIQRATALGWQCSYFTLHDLFCRDGHAYANVSAIVVQDEKAPHWAQTTPLGEKPL
ncbi:MAG TPA: glutathione synthase, partial [Legionella sp.]|nr:glutathione synthase [Legionella sp.]